MIQENVLEKRVVHTAQGDFTFTLFSGDLTHLYPGMVRYRVCVTDAMDRTVTEYFSNTFEYTPVMELDAKTAAINVLNEWERGFSRHPVDMLEYFSRLHPRCLPAAEATDVVVIQGSPPRPDATAVRLHGGLQRKQPGWGGLLCRSYTRMIWTSGPVSGVTSVIILGSAPLLMIWMRSLPWCSAAGCWRSVPPLSTPAVSPPVP
ncbi:hypothetical protein [Methanogenium cariaci]|uniref:hypothetical protein n=1 Tax=Methanogenium cariaci TaxID=2197 RepID=UPI0007860F45|nr:hypothetical protein [Methanogenium cariaci]